MVVATALGWGNTASVAISVVLAFLFGYALTLGPILRAGVEFHHAAGLTLASGLSCGGAACPKRLNGAVGFGFYSDGAGAQSTPRLGSVKSPLILCWSVPSASMNQRVSSLRFPRVKTSCFPTGDHP